MRFFGNESNLIYHASERRQIIFSFITYMSMLAKGANIFTCCSMIWTYTSLVHKELVTPNHQVILFLKIHFDFFVEFIWCC